jgi:hypothetical protein
MASHLPLGAIRIPATLSTHEIRRFRRGRFFFGLIPLDFLPKRFHQRLCLTNHKIMVGANSEGDLLSTNTPASKPEPTRLVSLARRDDQAVQTRA